MANAGMSGSLSGMRRIMPAREGPRYPGAYGQVASKGSMLTVQFPVQQTFLL